MLRLIRQVLLRAVSPRVARTLGWLLVRGCQRAEVLNCNCIAHPVLPQSPVLLVQYHSIILYHEFHIPQGRFFSDKRAYGIFQLTHVCKRGAFNSTGVFNRVLQRSIMLNKDGKHS